MGRGGERRGARMRQPGRDTAMGQVGEVGGRIALSHVVRMCRLSGPGSLQSHPVQTCTDTGSRSHTQNAPAHTCAHTCTHTHMQPHLHTHLHTHTRTRARTHTHTHVMAVPWPLHHLTHCAACCLLCRVWPAAPTPHTWRPGWGHPCALQQR